MENRNKGAPMIVSSILGIALAFQLCAAPNAWGQYNKYYNGGTTYDVSEASYNTAWIDGEGTVVNFNATIPGGIYMCWNDPGATLNFGANARASLIYAGPGSYVNIRGGSIGFLVSVSSGAQVTIYGERFEVYDWMNGTRQFNPGTTLYLENATVTAYDAWGAPLFSGTVSCSSDGATVLLASEAEDLDLDVQIDVKPGDDPSVINLNSNGMVPVAVLSDDTFDATQVQPESVRFAGAGVAVSGSGKYMAHAEDVDEDGDDDMLFHFRITDLELEDGSAETEVTLTGQMGSLVALRSASRINDGMPITGTDSVHILRPKKKKK